MTGIVIGIATVAGLFLLGKGYFMVLQTRYSEPAQADEVHTVRTEDGWQITLHRRHPRRGRGEPVLLCHSLSSNHLNFEIPAGESVVDVLVEAGYDCWGIDTRACRSAVPPHGVRKGSATLDGALLMDLPAAIAFIEAATGFPKIHWIGHSLGGMLLYAYALRFGGDRIASGVTWGSPPGFKGMRFREHVLLNAVAPIAHGIMEFFMRALIPFATRVRPKTQLLPINWDNVHPKLTNAELFHSVEMPAPKFAVQMDGWTTSGTWIMCGGALDVQERLPELTIPLLAVFGAADPLVPLHKARAFFDSLAHEDKRMLVLSKANGCAADYSHLELAFARDGRRDLYDPIVAWLKTHAISGVTSANA